ncbi:preprotein translocase subunit SecE [Pelotomaculum isophthalicicum JI]|uniref:Protein translocase subunit SecE n=1 Tax=Pelotomaculum isophthalicicum JI TaxID=947010 RepID=A0A9X4JV26_9FIRM|nr:preprotein translocase subunit SecE [Pelotomaculum isophthalicicum]MDF9407526.1 preprotein translocase subunit SecE [Pelotomaculum isophthalicicum JI]
MALMKKQDNNNKKESYKKETNLKEASKKTLADSKEKKVLVKKDSGKVVAKKDRVNRVEQIKKFARGVMNELKKVHWLNGREVVIYTSVVLLAVLFVGCLIWLFDSVLSVVLKLIMQR